MQVEVVDVRPNYILSKTMTRDERDHSCNHVVCVLRSRPCQVIPKMPNFVHFFRSRGSESLLLSEFSTLLDILQLHWKTPSYVTYLS